MQSSYRTSVTDFTHQFQRRDLPDFMWSSSCAECSDNRCYVGQLEEVPGDGKEKDQRSYANRNQARWCRDLIHSIAQVLKLSRRTVGGYAVLSTASSNS